MKSQSKVICAQCAQPIETLDDLVVRGLRCGLNALHKDCYERVKGQWIYRISLDMRGSGFWALLILLNALLVSCLIAFPGSWRDLRWFFLISNVPQLAFRLAAFVAYELPLRQ